MRNTLIGGLLGLVVGIAIGVLVLAPALDGAGPRRAAGGVSGAADFIAIGTGGVSGVYYPTGGAICLLINRGRATHGMRCSVESTGGSLYNLKTVRGGDLDLGIAQSDWQYHAYHGTSKFADQGPFPNLRSVFSLHLEPFTVVARADSGIRTLRDLKGKRINIGNPASGQRGTMEVLMKALGWTTDVFESVSELKSAEQSAALCAGAIDAMVFTVGHPSPSIKEATASCDSVLIDVTGPEVDRLVKENDYYRDATITGGLYRGNPDRTRTFGVGATVVTAAGVSADTIYLVVKSVFENFDAFRMLHPAFRDLKKEDMITFGLTAPLHEGAARYYREAGLL